MPAALFLNVGQFPTISLFGPGSSLLCPTNSLLIRNRELAPTGLFYLIKQRFFQENRVRKKKFPVNFPVNRQEQGNSTSFRRYDRGVISRYIQRTPGQGRIYEPSSMRGDRAAHARHTRFCANRAGTREDVRTRSRDRGDDRQGGERSARRRPSSPSRCSSSRRIGRSSTVA